MTHKCTLYMQLSNGKEVCRECWQERKVDLSSMFGDIAGMADIFNPKK